MYKYILKHIDKLLHFSLSYFLITFLYVALNLLFTIPLYSVIVLVALLGFLKEVYDEKKNKGAFDKYDLLADGIGIVLGTIIVLL